MRYFFIIMLISFASFSQTNEAVINQAIQTVKSQNITTQSQVLDVLKANGITELQARQLAIMRESAMINLLTSCCQMKIQKILIQKNLKFELGEEIEETNEEEKDNEDVVDVKDDGPNYFGYDIFDNNPFLEKEYLLGNIDEGYLISPGDELRIIIYGDNSFEQNVKVNEMVISILEDMVFLPQKFFQNIEIKT